MTETVLANLKTARTGLRVKGLQKSFRRRSVLQDVSLELQRGEVVALLGPNGAGKTTCFYAVAGLQQPDHGQITLDGQDVTLWPVYRRARLGLGYLPQESSIFRGLSVEENIRAVLEVTEKSAAVIQERLQRLLDEFGLTRLRGSPAMALSGGERRRVEIARAMAANPAYMMLDEPFAGVDPIAIADIRKLVMGLKERGIGVLITDHNVRETLSLVDRAYIIYEGRVIMQGTPQEIVANDEVRRVYLGEEFSLG
jgi:lipopolysaccharide export system ATP-binding protein